MISTSITSDSDEASYLSSRCKYLFNPYTVPHLGIGYIGSLLAKNNFKVVVAECGQSNLKIKDVLDLVIKKKYDAVGISVYSF